MSETYDPFVYWVQSNDEQTLKILRGGLRGLEWIFRSVVNSVKLRLNTSKTSKISKFMKKKFFSAFLCCKNAYKGRSFFSALFQLFKAFSWKNHNCKNLTIYKISLQKWSPPSSIGRAVFLSISKIRSLNLSKDLAKMFQKPHTSPRL